MLGENGLDVEFWRAEAERYRQGCERLISLHQKLYGELVAELQQALDMKGEEEV